MPKTLQELLSEQFGVKVRAVEDPGGVTSLGTTAQTILPNNANRVGWIITNLSTNIVYLDYKNAVASTKAFALLKQGDSAISVWNQDFDLVGWAVWGVASGAASAIRAVSLVSS